MSHVFARFIVIIGLVSLTWSGAMAAERNPAWAAPLESPPGVSNLHRVTPFLYRSAQPTATGMKSLEKMGIKTVINLRTFHTDTKELKGTKLIGKAVPMNAWNAETEDVVRALQMLSDPSGAPYLVHCQHGADRTGMIMAMYRIVVQGWSKEDAIDEMVNGGYGFHAVWQNIIDYVRNADIEAIKAGLAAASKK